MSTEETASGPVASGSVQVASGPVPLYARALRLRRLRIGGLASFLLVECTIAAAILLALAELVSWWAVPVLPLLVAAVVKINDLVGAPPVAGATTSEDAAPGTAAVSSSMPSIGASGGNRRGDGRTRVGAMAAGWGRADDRISSDGIPADRTMGEWSAPAQVGTHRQRHLASEMVGSGRGRFVGPAADGEYGSGRHAATAGARRAGSGIGEHGVGRNGTAVRGASTGSRFGGGAPPVGQGLAGSLPPGTPGSQAPRRAQIIGAAVRRSMAAQAQFGAGGTAAARGDGSRNVARAGAFGRHASGGTQSTGRHAGLNAGRAGS